MEESYIERFHQIRGRFAKIILGLRSDKCLNWYKTKHQSVSMNKDIKQCQDVVRMKKKRKFKKETVPQKNQKLKQEIKKEKRKDNIYFQ